ncbi:MAG TPA: sigma factor, partial [Pyrinomonadaceae bacterium]|nr:sigma factor [Pyrinomonadaceae bacterium]
MSEVTSYPFIQSATKRDVSADAAQPATDYALAQMSAGGDMLAFEELYERHSRRVYSLCLRMTANTAEAEDLTQEVFIQLHRK